MTTPRRAPGGFPVVGIVGGGQLARMCAGPAAELGVTLSVLAEAPDASAALVVPSAPVGHHTDTDAVLRFASACDVVTFDHEHVPPEVLERLVASGVAVHPAPEALRFAQDKLAMRERLGGLGVPCPRWARADTLADVEAFGREVGWPLVAKTPRGGYDGRGVRVVSAATELAEWLERAATTGTGLLLEERVDFRRELAVLLARSPSGQAAAWPVVETVQTDGICTEVLAPAPGLDPDLSARAVEAGLRVAGELGVTGVLAVELFEVEDAGGAPGFVVNELAMRPHNSGHWSMDGAVTGQFEQHLRAVLDLPLGSPRPHAPWTVMANVLGGDYPQLYPAYRHVMARDPEVKVHLYGKDVRPGRKIGHVNVSGGDLADLRERAVHAADYLTGVVTQ
ncbi:5-(carboxyamino)imidazole ribonucleotide synthase [Phycicoccus endophyticus]|uniref:N5-carboxyaminoimidazole ribonucleotide synthase n=1 Tax=Phycicoccus endophyticus TaxID=1690220 RepID=A0A7G9R309_9MICO|nr:5-(carboxyamino)imidazole ribonucleotide synthase [Phycicoccus endophyticus]NHI20277.1 5-(carboxyamino)imidazole ribonucleotide synthase [Phycicoccus endophyticus]QNN49984.1 5-(carboxyamino)imidazole ribonucleotide synthase [Phycicoccus endophyticus]GGL29071.1 N5-carboxyaminoimidazole ribonucleotide synthase [Phycicoccus endophyticus]